MKSIVVMFGVILCLVAVHGRHVEVNENENLPESDKLEFTETHEHKERAQHRRRSRQMHGYDYNPPPYYPDHHNDYSRSQDYRLQHIITLLGEISRYVKWPQQPPPPPQPIYIPYPVPYAVPTLYQNCGSDTRVPVTSTKPSVATTTTTESPGDDLTNKFNKDQVWGISTNEDDYSEYDENDGARPISFDPIKPNRPLSRTPPPVDHGSSQAGKVTTTRATVTRRPGVCEAAILSCCGISNDVRRKDCFANYRCTKAYASSNACKPEAIQRVLNLFAEAYAPATIWGS